MKHCVMSILLVALLTTCAVGATPPIFTAVGRGDVDAVRAILKEDPAAVRAKDGDGSQPLHAAGRIDRKDIAELLLKSGADINALDQAGHTPLYHALGNARGEQVAELLLRRGAKVHADKGDSVRLLAIASSQGYVEVTRLLLAAKAHVKDGKVQADTPLYAAADHGHLEVVKLLVAAGADVNYQTFAQPDFIGGINRSFNGMQTPLLVASSGGHVETAEYLLEKKANPNLRDQFGLSALDHAARIGNKQIAEMLIAHKASVARPVVDKPKLVWALGGFQAGGFAGTSPLHWAAEGGHDEIVALLLEKSADPKTLDTQKRTPLHRLLDDVDYSRVAGLRVVMHGIQQFIEPKVPGKLKKGRRDRALVHLLKHGADVNAQDSYHHTPLYYAQKHVGGSELPNLLIAAGAMLSFVDAVELQHVLQLEALLAENPELATLPVAARTPLRVARTPR